MTVDYNKLGVIGVDRIVINNFKILNFEDLEKKEIINKLERIQRYEIKDNLFHLIYSQVSKTSGEKYSYATLEFNPTKMKFGHNIYNSNELEILESLNIITTILLNDGIKINLSEAKIKEIEINITLNIPYEILNETILLILKANSNRAIGVYSISDSYVPWKIKQDRCIYINTKSETKEVTGKIIKVYDKSFEMLHKHNKEIQSGLTRVEVLFGRDYYRYTLENMGLDNSLDTFLKASIAEQLFVKAIEYELKIKPMRELDKIKSNLEKAFNNFRRTERNKRKERNRLKKIGKEIPKYLKEERGVFEYLRRESWIFDYSFLYEIVKDNVVSKHRKDYERQIIKKYLNINNKQIFTSFLKLIFLPI